MNCVENDLTRLETWHGHFADGMLKAEGFNIDVGSRELLLKELNRTNVQAHEVLERNAEGDDSKDPKVNRFPEWNLSSPSSKVTLQTLFELWKKEHLADKHAAKTVTDFQQKVSSFESYLGHSNANNLSATPGKTFADRAGFVIKKLNLGYSCWC